MRLIHSLAAAAVALATALGVPATATAEPSPYDTPSEQQWSVQDIPFAGPNGAATAFDNESWVDDNDDSWSNAGTEVIEEALDGSFTDHRRSG